MNHLLSVWLSGSEKESKPVREKLDEKLDSYGTGELEHAVDAISFIWEIANKEGPIPSAPTSPPPPSSRSSRVGAGRKGPAAWQGYGTQRALVKSIQAGSLLDRKYWARRSREGGIEPIHVSSAVAGIELSRLGSRE